MFKNYLLLTNSILGELQEISGIFGIAQVADHGIYYRFFRA